MITWRKNPDSCCFEGNLFRNLKWMKPIFFMCLDMFIWLLLHGAKCNISQWCISSGEENITSWDEQKAASSFGGKCAIARNLKTIALFDQFSLFFSHLRNISQTNFSERSSRMAQTLNETEMSETQWVVLKKVDHDYTGNLYRFASFGNSRSLSLRCKEPNATVDFSPFLQIVIKIPWYLGDWNTATDFREKPSSFWAKNLKTPRFRLCRTRSFLCEDKFQRYYHWKICCRWKDVNWDNDRRHGKIFWKNKSVFKNESITKECFDVMVA